MYALAAESASSVTSNPDLLLSLGVGGVFCVMILRLVFEFLKSRKEPMASSGGQTDRLARSMNVIELLSDIKDLLTSQQSQSAQIKEKVTRIQTIAFDMKRLHDVPDPKYPGNQLWWGTGQREALEKLVISIENLRRQIDDSAK